jgi:hypothetical protein
MARLEELHEFHMPGSVCVNWLALNVDCGHFVTKCQFSGQYAQLLSITVSVKCCRRPSNSPGQFFL